MINETVLDNGQMGKFAAANLQLKKLERTKRVQKPNIVTLLPRGEAIRNFVYTGVLDEISRDAKVTLLSVVPNTDLETILRAHSDEFIPLNGNSERPVVEVIREILDMAHGKWLWSKAAQERWLIHDSEASKNGGQWKRNLKKVACAPFANRSGLRMLSWVERKASRKLKTNDDYINLFKKIDPEIVFNGSHVHGKVALQAVQAAQWLGIPTVAFIFSWDNLTSQGRIFPPYDYYLVWNESLRNQLLNIYDSIKPEQVIVTGSPQFDFHFRREFLWTRADFCARVGADPNRPIVLYTTGMANHMPGEPLIVEQLAQMLRNMPEFGSPQLLVRVYPKDLTNRFEDVRKRNPDVLFPVIPWENSWLTPKFEDSYLLTNMLRHAAVGVNISSTVSLELCMFDKPVINVGFNPSGIDISPIDFARYYEFDHYRFVVESGAVRVAWSEAEMQQLLRDALVDPGKDRLMRQALIRNMFGNTLDGYSGTRVAHCLVNLGKTRLACA